MTCILLANSGLDPVSGTLLVVSFIAAVQSIYGWVSIRRLKQRDAMIKPSDQEVTFTNEGFGAIDDLVPWENVLEVIRAPTYWAIRCIRNNEETECLM